MTAIALLLGLGAAWAAARAAARMSAIVLYGIRPHDLVTFTAAPVLLAAVDLLARWIPARRAARVNPLTALRHE